MNELNYWQTDGNTSKYDFAFLKGNAEVKSCTKNHEVMIKHEQVFNDDNNYIVVVALERNPSGETLVSLINKLLDRVNCFTTLHSRLELNKRMLQIHEKDLNKRYRVCSVRCYSSDAINMFRMIPDRVSELTYRLDLTDMQYIEPIQLINRIV